MKGIPQLFAERQIANEGKVIKIPHVLKNCIIRITSLYTISYNTFRVTIYTMYISAQNLRLVCISMPCFLMAIGLETMLYKRLNNWSKLSWSWPKHLKK